MVSARRPGRARGFTLIELLIALALATVGLVGLLALQSIAIRGNMMSRNFGEAVGVAQQRLEIAERTPYASLSTLTETVTANIDPVTDAASSSPQAIYTRTTTVTVNGDDTTEVLVVVGWNDTRNASHSITLRTKRSP